MCMLSIQYSLSYTCSCSRQFLFNRKTYRCSSNKLCSSYNHILTVRPHLITIYILSLSLYIVSPNILQKCFTMWGDNMCNTFLGIIADDNICKVKISPWRPYMLQGDNMCLEYRHKLSPKTIRVRATIYVTTHVLYGSRQVLRDLVYQTRMMYINHLSRKKK